MRSYLQSLISSRDIKWGYVHMEMIRYNIRVSNMWRNVHKGFCLCYVCNCRHIYIVYVCTHVVHSYVHFHCDAAFAAIRIWYSYSITMYVRVWIRNGFMDINTGTSTVGSLAHIREVHGLYIVCYIKSSLLGILYKCVKWVKSTIGFPMW